MNTWNSVVIPLHSPHWEEDSNYCLQSRRNLCFLKSCYHSFFYWCQNYSMCVPVFEYLASCWWHNLFWSSCMLWNEHCMSISENNHAGKKFGFPYRGRTTELVCFCLIPTMHNTTNYLAIENRVAMFCFLNDQILQHVLVVPQKISTEYNMVALHHLTEIIKSIFLIVLLKFRFSLKPD